MPRKLVQYEAKNKIVFQDTYADVTFRLFFYVRDYIKTVLQFYTIRCTYTYQFILLFS